MAENIDVNLNITGNANRALTSLNRDLDKVSGSFSNMRNAIAGLALGSLVNNLLNTSAALVDLSKATGLTVEAVKGLSDALSKNGGDSDKAKQAMIKFSETLDEAREGSRKAQQAFQAAGIGVGDLTKPTTELFLQFAENVGKIAESEGEIRAMGVATEITGKALKGADLKGFGRDVRSATESAKEFTPAIVSADAVQQQLEDTIKKAKDELLLFLKPVLDFLATEEGFKTFTTTIKTLAIVFGIMFGAKMIKNIIDFNKALASTETIGKQLGKNPIMKLLGLAVAVGGVEKLTEYFDKANEGAKELDENLSNLPPATTTAPAQTTTAAAPVNTKETDILIAGIKNSTKAYEEQVAQIKNNVSEQLNALKVGQDQAALDKIRADIEEKAADAIKKFNEEKQKLDPTKDADLIKVINDQIASINRGKEATIQAAQAEQQALTQLQIDVSKSYAMMENSVVEYQNALQNNEALQQLKDQSEQVGVYGKELEKLQARQKIDQELRQRTNELNAEAVKLTFDMAKAVQAGNAAEAEAIRIKIEGIERVRQAEEQAAAERKQQTNQNIEDSTMANKSIFDQIKDGIGKQRAELEKYNLGDSLVQGLSQAIDTFVETGKFKFKDFAGALLREWLAMKAKMSLFDLLDQLSNGLKGIFSGMSFGGGGGGDLFGSILKGIGSIFGFANGGNPPVNKPSIVGEKGPELFVPKTAGTVVPNDMLGMNRDRQVVNNYITNNINALDSKSVAQVFAENRKTLLGTVQMAQREMPFG